MLVTSFAVYGNIHNFGGLGCRHILGLIIQITKPSEGDTLLEV